ncbi:glycoside hydrolase family 55 protein [Westerdykella ornata]|uniref:Glycoside hydrolase family 55 protein n=1 Tax=Westerdykella ornata TaxID=318751 RepID=A0A6A6J6G0_WESOR|nr:glycoside hydrolase family 55 protein [Westerdykella ornata]KAF2272161.1 glycoside hydrolase family 55 protein [Westerdykella ornata]
MRTLLIILGLAATTIFARPNESPANASAAAASTYWYANVLHNGINPGLSKNWVVFRNVRDHGARGDGVTDDTIAIRTALAIGDNSIAARGSGWWGTTGQPAVVYFPPGTYVVSSTIQNLIGTVWMGDPTDRPRLKASKDFSGTTMIAGADKYLNGPVGFYTEMKNLVFDSTAVSASANLTLVDWNVSQGCQLSNSGLEMPKGAKGHVGIRAVGKNSPLLLNDLEVRGGGAGYVGESMQYHFKNVYFKGVETGIKPANVVQMTVQGCRFEDVTTGVDMSGGTLRLLNMIDSTASNTETLVKADEKQSGTVGSIVLENVLVDSTVSSTVKAGDSSLLTGSIATGTTWIRGNIYTGRSPSSKPEKLTGQKISTSRPSALVNGTGFYHTVKPPAYADFSLEQIVNVRDVAAHPVKGDGETDDTASLQAILNDAAKAGKVAYFPHGTYILKDTLHIPPNSRLWGESFTELSGAGPLFQDPRKSKPVIQVGRPGDTGVAQFTDFVFTARDILPGAVLVEVNMAGAKPGDVGFFNTHIRLGGALDNKANECPTVEECRAVHIAAHLTSSSSSYWENSWAWTADHDLDGWDGFAAYPSPAGGFLIEAQKGTWMLGWGVEHFALYQVNIVNAANVFVGIQQGEASLYQGVGNSLLAPRPWESELLAGEPSFAWCAANDASCRMSIYQSVVNSTNINLYSGGYWTFAEGSNQTACNGDCQTNAVFYVRNSKLFSYGIAAINNANVVVERAPGGSEYVPVAKRADNQGFRKDGSDVAVVAAYLRQSG